MGKTKRRISRGRARSGREPLRQRGHASTGLSTARIARCAVLVRTVVGAISARSAVGHQSASTVVCALHARSAVGHQSASTVVSALSARSAVGHRICEHGRQRSNCKECGGSQICEHGRRRSQCKECGGCINLRARSSALFDARSAVGLESASTVVSAIGATSARSSSHHDST